MGYEREELIGNTYRTLDSSMHDADFFKQLGATVNSGETWVGEVCNRTKDGSLLWFDNIITPLFGEDGFVTAHLSVRKDISDRKAIERELQRSESFLKNVAAVSKVGGWTLDLDTQTLHWSDQTKLIHDLPADFEPRLDEAINYYAPEARSTITHAVEQAINTGQSWDMELPLITAKARKIWVRAVGHLVKKEGAATLLVGAFQDITERKHAEDMLHKEIQQRHTAEQLLRDVLETIPDAVAAFDGDDRLMICNQSYMKTYAASADAIMPGASFEDIIRFGLSRGQFADAGKSKDAQERWLARRLADHRDPPEQLNQKLRDGTWLQVREHRSPTGTTVGVRTDITTVKRAEERMRRFAEEDPLTGLSNRARFCGLVDEAMATLEQGLKPNSEQVSSIHGCVALFDLDHFKPINDAYGHGVGDEVLVETARRMRSVLGSDDVGARLGGDEFVFLLMERHDEAACEQTLAALFEAMKAPIETNAGPIFVTLSLGAVAFQDGLMHSRELLKQADLAQYRAKEKGRSQWCWFGKKDREKLLHEAQLGKALEQDLNNGDGMRCRFTPAAASHDGAFLGFSAELIWTHEGEELAADALRALAQKSGQSARLCDHKLSKALLEIGAQESRGVGCCSIWMTINADCLKIAQFAENLSDLCEKADVPLRHITIAVDEDALGQRSASAVEAALAQMKAMGVCIAIDTFGSAASSVSKLKTLGVDAVRLAPSLTDSLTDPEACDKVVSGLIGLARTLGIQICATNIQTPAHAARLAALGCDVLQGPVISKPLLVGDLPHFLAVNAAQQLAGLSASMRGADQPKAEDAA